MTSEKASPSREPNAGSIALSDANCIVMRLDGEGRVVFLNAFGLDFFGYQDAEILGRHAVGTIVPEKDHSGNDLAAMIDDWLRHSDDYATYGIVKNDNGYIEVFSEPGGDPMASLSKKIRDIWRTAIDENP